MSTTSTILIPKFGDVPGRDRQRTPGPSVVNGPHERVRQQAMRRADSIALWTGDESVTFGDLWANVQLDAASIRAALTSVLGANIGGHGQGVDGSYNYSADAPRIGLAIPRSADLVSLVLGALGSGAAFVPLDPSLPSERLAYMAEDSGVSLVVLPSSERPGWLADNIESISVHELRAIGCVGGSSSLCGPEPEGLAYVIYTSGSTGRPKGVRITNKNLSLLLDGWRSVVHLETQNSDHDPCGHPRLEQNATFLFQSTLSFDASLTEFLWPLTEGHRVVIAPDGAHASFGQSLGALIERHQVTHLQCTPTRAVLLLADRSDRRSLRLLHQILLGGEPLQPAIVQKLRAEGVERVTNIYGPTECSIWSFSFDVESTGEARVPIGRPIPGVRSFVVDESLRPVADGVEGELLIAGQFVGDGYHGRADLTAKSFRTCTFDGEVVRVYRTGDRVVRRSNGVHDFLGRIDTQVKLRGIRIELGEIESVLVEQPSIAQAAAAVVVGEMADDRLVAYIVPSPDEVFDEEEVRRALSERLTSAMIPSAYLVLDRFPLTPSGKVDRRALADRLPQVQLAAVETPGQCPTTELDRMLADFSTVFNRHVGPDDDFFDLGGHSLLAVQLISLISSRDGVDRPLTVLLDAPTPRMLAKLAGPGETSSLVRFGESGAAVRLYLVHGAGGNVIGFRELAHQLAGLVEVIGIQASGVEPGREADKSMIDMVERYVTAILEDDPDGPYWLGGYSDGGIIAMHVAQGIIQRGKTILGLVVVDSSVTEPTVPNILGRLANVLRNARDRGGRPVAHWLGCSWRAWRSRTGSVDPTASVATEIGYVAIDKIVNDAVSAAGPPGQIHAPGLLLRSMETTPTLWFDYSFVEPTVSALRTVWVPGGHATVLLGDNARIVADSIIQFTRR
jgi:amino acid adenylation domain-containing protein